MDSASRLPHANCKGTLFPRKDAMWEPHSHTVYYEISQWGGEINGWMDAWMNGKKQ